MKIKVTYRKMLDGRIGITLLVIDQGDYPTTGIVGWANGEHNDLNSPNYDIAKGGGDPTCHQSSDNAEEAMAWVVMAIEKIRISLQAWRDKKVPDAVIYII